VVSNRRPDVWKRAHGAMRQIPHAHCGAGGREQISATQPCASRSVTRANSRTEERAASHPRPAPCGRWRLSSAPRLRRATSPTSRRAASRLRRESHDEPKVQRTLSMTGNVAIETKLTEEGYGGQGGSAYRRSGRFASANRPVRRVQRKRRLVFTAKRNVGTKCATFATTPGRSPAQHRNDERGLSRWERLSTNRFVLGNPIGVV
jgi:hypothetical protein